jgi:monovalent cation:H+ antiporter-2, CPA2 family
MPAPHDFLRDLALVLCVAAVTSALCRALRQPTILGYLIAGMLVGPHVPIPIVADTETVSTLADLGIMLVMFSLGLEFTFAQLARAAPACGLIAIVKCSVMVWAGFTVARAFGWTVIEGLFAGVMVSITSTMIVAQYLRDRKAGGKLARIVLGILVVEDVIAFVMLTVLTGLSTGATVSAGEVGMTIARFAVFLVAMVVAGIFIVPRGIRAVVKLGQPETIVMASIGVCFAFALAARSFGFSVALGAFVAGALVAESGEEQRVTPLVNPVRDLFAAIFFVAVGMLIEPALVREHWVPIAILTAVVLVGHFATGALGAFLTGQGVLTAIQTGMTIAVIGEVSFIVARIGAESGAAREFLLPVAVAVSVVTTIASSGMSRAAPRAARFVDRTLPRPLQTFATLYGSWIENMRTAPAAGESGRSRVRRLVRALVVDAVLIAAIVIATSKWLAAAAIFVASRTGASPGNARLAVVAAGILISAPFWIGIVRNSRLLSLALSAQAWPAVAAGQLDLAAAPRRAFVLGLQLTIVLLLGAPLLAVTQPFLPPLQGAFVLAAAVAALGFAVWRSATNLQGHVRAGAQMIVQALAKQTPAHAVSAARGPRDGDSERRTLHDPDERDAERDDAAVLERVGQVLPGLGALSTVHLDAAHHAVGRTLSDLDVRGRTGATVLAITRGVEGVSVPTGHETLRAGDILCMTGTHDAIAGARELLGSGEVDAPRD